MQYVWRFLRSHKIDLVARKSWCESNDPNFTAKAADVVGLYVAPPEPEGRRFKSCPLNQTFDSDISEMARFGGF